VGTEKSVVTGRQAAAIAADFGMECDAAVPAAPDTVQLSSLRKIARLIRAFYRRRRCHERHGLS
jgi:hypothetical protein